MATATPNRPKPGPAPERYSGTLLHLSSLPGPGPIGTMGASARAFVDFLRAGGQRVWQLLPLTPPARGNSPYSSNSAFAGNPFFIDLPTLEAQGLLDPGATASLHGSPDEVDYAACQRELPPLLRRSFHQGAKHRAPQLASFRERHAHWLEDYALFMALSGRHGTDDFRVWPQPLKAREPEALRRAALELREEVEFWVWVQFLFFEQWLALRAYAGEHGVRLFGDIPIYADLNSADVWAHPHLFQLDEDLNPTSVAGVPPDGFSKTGQLWGNPLYRWDTLRESGYRWWQQRLEMAHTLYDSVRIDHFRGIEAYYAIPAGDPDATGGRWVKGPGLHFLEAMRASVPGCDLVAEDLGYLTDSVRELRRDSGIPGVKVLQFAFDPREQSTYLPHRIERDCVAYIGTHDNDTALGWLRSAPATHVAFARSYMALNEEEGAHWGIIRTLYGSAAKTVVVQMQDYLGLGSEARMNVPAQPEGNWRWRMPPDALSRPLARKIRRLGRLYGRLPQHTK